MDLAVDYPRRSHRLNHRLGVDHRLNHGLLNNRLLNHHGLLNNRLNHRLLDNDCRRSRGRLLDNDCRLGCQGTGGDVQNSQGGADHQGAIPPAAARTAMATVMVMVHNHGSGTMRSEMTRTMMATGTCKSTTAKNEKHSKNSESLQKVVHLFFF